MEHENIDDHEWDLAAPDRIGEIDERLTNDAQMRELEAFLEPRLCRLLTLIADGYRYRECARILGIPDGTIGPTLKRMREKMKKPENRKKIDKILK